MVDIPPKARRRKYVWILVAVLLVSAAPIALYVLQAPIRAAERQAWTQYVKARPAGLKAGTQDFDLMGLKAGETVQEVNERFKGATDRYVGTGLNPPWNGQILMYRFQYGPTVKPVFKDFSVYTTEESFTVYFTPDGRAAKVARYYQIGCAAPVDSGLKEYVLDPELVKKGLEPTTQPGASQSGNVGEITPP